MNARRLRRYILLTLCIAVITLTACSPKEHTYEPRGNTVVLMYHTFLSGDEVPETNRDIYTNAVKVEDDIKTLLGLGYKPISLNNLYENKNDADSRYFAITFDDGYLTNYSIAYPILLKYNCYADIFINTDNEYMEHHFSFEQALEMEESGLVTVHSHFPDHENVCDYAAGDFESELNRSFDTLTANLGERQYRFFSYPFGAYNAATLKSARKADVKLQFVQGLAADINDGDVIVRTNVSYDADIKKLMETAHWN